MQRPGFYKTITGAEATEQKAEPDAGGMIAWDLFAPELVPLTFIPLLYRSAGSSTPPNSGGRIYAGLYGKLSHVAERAHRSHDQRGQLNKLGLPGGLRCSR